MPAPVLADAGKLNYLFKLLLHLNYKINEEEFCFLYTLNRRPGIGTFYFADVIIGGGVGFS